MIMVDVKDILTFVMENTEHEVDMSRYWFKYDTDVGLLEKDLYAIYEKDYIEHLKNEKLIRQAKPYILTYAPLIIFPIYCTIYNNMINDPEMIISNKLLTKSCMIMGEHIINTSEDNIVLNILNTLHLNFNNNSNFHLYIHMLRKLGLNIINKYYQMLEDRILKITINKSGIMYIELGKNIYEYRYKELEDSKEIGYGDVYGE